MQRLYFSLPTAVTNDYLSEQQLGYELARFATKVAIADIMTIRFLFCYELKRRI
jgi:hypothetical protein